MSVIKSKRGESQVQFLQTARDLFKFTQEQCVKLPKRYTFFGKMQTFDCASRMMANVKRGNSIYPRNNHEVQMRRDYFLTALSELQVLAEHIDNLRGLFNIKDTIMVKWMELLTDEIKLLKALVKKDNERFQGAFEN